MKSLLALSLALLPLSASAQLLPHLVFSKTSIQSQKSDYQGKTGANGAIDLEDFEIVGDLDSATQVKLVRGSVRGQVSAPNVSLQKATGRKVRFTQAKANSLYAASYELDALALRLSSYPATAAAEFAQREVRGRTAQGLLFKASQALEVIDINASELNRTNTLIFEGNGSSQLLIRVRGSSVSLQRKETIVTQGIRPEQITFFFPEARSLELSYSGGAMDPATNIHWGIPGSVVAPNALVHFAEILVTGRLYAGQICTDAGLNGGQVNYARNALIEGGSTCPTRCGQR